MSTITSRLWMRAACGALLFALAPLAARAQVLDSAQQGCVNALNKDAAKIAAAQGKLVASCLKDAGKGKLPSGQSADACLTADAKGQIAKGAAKISSDYSGKCVDDPPTFGVPGGSVAAIVGDVPVDQVLSLFSDVFGASLTTAALDCATDKGGCKCQQTVAKSTAKLAATKFKEFVKCKKGALKAGGSSAAAIEDCLTDVGTAGSVAADSKGKIAKAVGKLGDGIATHCASDPFQPALPGLCAGLLGDPLRDCIDTRVSCRLCLTLKDIDNLSVDCDQFDDGQLNLSCPYETFTMRSTAEPLNTPGSPPGYGLNAKLITQFGADVNLNNARFTRFRLNTAATKPDAILILIPGFEGGANDFKIFSENLIPRVAATQGKLLEVWAYDRRSNQLEDQVGLDIAEAHADPLIALDWMFGSELTLPLSPALAGGPNRRAVFYNAQSETAYIANWTPLVFSRDIDAIVEKARTIAKNGNVFLGGHSAGTGFTARYAATDFNFTGVGPAQPGYAKLRGLVLLEGNGGNTAGAPLTPDTLDRIEAKFDGGLFAAVRDNAGRCVDGATACTVATESTDCNGQTPPKCTQAMGAYSTGLLNPRLLAGSQATGIQAINDPDTGRNILIADQGSPGNNAVAKVADLASLGALPAATAEGGLGSFIDDDGLVASIAPFVATSVGGPGPIVGGLTTWQDITEGPLPLSLLPNNGPPPTSLPAGVWGQEKEVTRMDRMTANFYAGHTDFTDWYYPASGLSVTSVSGKCTGSTCTVGNVGASCSTDANCNQAISLDSSALSIGRGRRDIENLTQAAGINVPVIAFGASNGLATVPGAYTPFAQSIGTCTAPSCNGSPRVIDASTPNPAFPTFGGVNGGFEVHISEGYAHVDIVTAEDDANNNVLAPLSAFIARNVQ